MHNYITIIESKYENKTFFSIKPDLCYKLTTTRQQDFSKTTHLLSSSESEDSVVDGILII